MKPVLLTRGQVALVDDIDFDRVSRFDWFAQKTKRGGYYAARDCRDRAAGTGDYLYLHQFILGIKGVDHKDSDGLNNVRENLRAATQAQNMQSRLSKPRGATSRYRGVRWHSQRGGWTAQIKADGRQIYLGKFSEEGDAARAYDKAAIELFGEFASPNFS